eukprot:g8695.t1
MIPKAEQEKLRRYAEGLPAETVEDAKDGDPRGRSSASAPPNRARPPLLPSLERRKPEDCDAMSGFDLEVSHDSPQESRERDTGAQANREGGSRGSRRGSRGRSSISPSPSVVSLPDIETGLVAGSAQVAVVGLAPAGPASPTLEVLPALEELASPSVAMQEPGASCDMFHSDQAMFRRFAEALDQQSSSQGSLLLRGAFQSVIAMVWARQQLSVVLGRLRGYFQPWLLGWWPMSSYPLLSPEDPYFMQAEIRLRVMMSQLDALRAQEQQPSVYKLMQDSEPNSKLISWQALADLLVVHHPGTATGRPRNPAPKTILEPVAKGIVPLAPHFGRDARQRAWLLPFSGCWAPRGIVASLTWCLRCQSSHRALWAGRQGRRPNARCARSYFRPHPLLPVSSWARPARLSPGVVSYEDEDGREEHRMFAPPAPSSWADPMPLLVLILLALSPIAYYDFPAFLVVTSYLAALTFVQVRLQEVMDVGYPHPNTILAMHMLALCSVTSLFAKPRKEDALQWFAMKALGPLMASIIGNLNLLVVIALSNERLHEQFTWEFLGATLLASGTFASSMCSALRPVKDATTRAGNARRLRSQRRLQRRLRRTGSESAGKPPRFLRRGIGARSRRRVVAIGVACLVMGTWVASLFASAWCGGSLVSAHSSRQLQMNAKKRLLRSLKGRRSSIRSNQSLGYSILAEELLGSFVDGDKDRLDQFLTKAGIAQWQLLLVQLVEPAVLILAYLTCSINEATYLNHLTHKLSQEKSDWSGSPTSTVSTACDSDEVTPCHEIEMPPFGRGPFENVGSSSLVFTNGKAVSPRQRLLLQSLKIQEFTALIAQEVRERPNSGVPAGAAEELLAALEDEAQGAPLPRIPDRDLRNLRKTFVARRTSRGGRPWWSVDDLGNPAKGI